MEESYKDEKTPNIDEFSEILALNELSRIDFSFPRVEYSNHGFSEETQHSWYNDLPLWELEDLIEANTFYNDEEAVYDGNTLETSQKNRYFYVLLHWKLEDLKETETKTGKRLAEFNEAEKDDDYCAVYDWDLHDLFAANRFYKGENRYIQHLLQRKIDEIKSYNDDKPEFMRDVMEDYNKSLDEEQLVVNKKSLTKLVAKNEDLGGTRSQILLEWKKANLKKSNPNEHYQAILEKSEQDAQVILEKKNVTWRKVERKDREETQTKQFKLHKDNTWDELTTILAKAKVAVEEGEKVEHCFGLKKAKKINRKPVSEKLEGSNNNNMVGEKVAEDISGEMKLTKKKANQLGMNNSMKSKFIIGKENINKSNDKPKCANVSKEKKSSHKGDVQLEANNSLKPISHNVKNNFRQPKGELGKNKSSEYFEITDCGEFTLFGVRSKKRSAEVSDKNDNNNNNNKEHYEIGGDFLQRVLQAKSYPDLFKLTDELGAVSDDDRVNLVVLRVVQALARQDHRGSTLWVDSKTTTVLSQLKKYKPGGDYSSKELKNDLAEVKKLFKGATSSWKDTNKYYERVLAFIGECRGVKLDSDKENENASKLGSDELKI